jgi:hypothetical protein
MASTQTRSVTSRGIASVVRFLPAILNGDFRFCDKMDSGTDDPDCLPPSIPSSEAIEFIRAVEKASKSLQESLREWGATREARQLLTSIDAILGEKDELRLMKLLALHVRTDRMVRGHLEEAIRSGHITAILSRLSELQREDREEM